MESTSTSNTSGTNRCSRPGWMNMAFSQSDHVASHSWGVAPGYGDRRPSAFSMVPFGPGGLQPIGSRCFPFLGRCPRLRYCGIDLSKQRTGRRSPDRRKSLQEWAVNAKRPAIDLSTPGVNWCGVSFRRKNRSAPGRTRTYDTAVNSRSLYQLSYRSLIFGRSA